MIILKIKGGLGNQLFQYTLGTFIKEKYNIPVKYDISWFALNHKLVTPRENALDLIIKDFDSKKATHKEIDKIKFPAFLYKSSFNENLDYISLVLNKYFNKSYYLEPQSYDINKLIRYKYLDGYWQSKLYVSEVINKLEADFNQPYLSQLNSENMYLKDISNTDVCVHIRRGDYVHNAAANTLHGTCSVSYYQEGIAYFNQNISNPRYFFFSDDIDWVKETFGTQSNYIFVTLDTPSRDIAEFFMMSSFKNFIIANSTYSWWAAILSKSLNVVAPKLWFVNGHNQLALDKWKLI